MNTNIKLVLPDRLKNASGKKRLIALEGVDGSGKTTLCQCLDAKYSDIRFVEIAKEYVSAPFVEYLVEKTSDIGNSLVFAASLADRKNMMDQLDDNIRTVVMDRSLWSTVAMSYVRSPEKAQDVINMFDSLAHYMPIPEIVYLLDVPYSECRNRILRRDTSTLNDNMSEETYNRHMEFYYWLSTQNVGVHIIKWNNTTIEETLDAIIDHTL